MDKPILPLVLIAEDDENSLLLLENALASQGYRYFSATNGQQALDFAKTVHPDLIISDILMPVMDGYALCRAIKKDATLKSIPFIFYTATYTDQKDKSLALSLGADRFLVKPLEIDKLLAIIAEVLRSPLSGISNNARPVLADVELISLHCERLQSKLDKKIAELKKQNDRLQESEQRFRDYAEASADWFWEADQNLVFTHVSGGPVPLLSRSLLEFVTETCKGFYSTEIDNKSLHAIKHQKVFHDLIADIKNDKGHVFSLRFSGKPIYDRLGQFSGYRGVGTDVTETMLLMRQVEYLATHDKMTGLPNRAHFWERLDLAIAQAERQAFQVIVIFIDVDNFKMINDSLGHDAGDKLLLEISHRIKKTVRAEDTLARIGGDEFVLIMERATPMDAHRIALEILKKFEAPITVCNQRVFITVSMGLSVYPDDTDQPKTLVTYADLAMYRSKDKGRNNFHYYTDDLNTLAGEWLFVENGLRQALAKDELFLEYQPQVDLKTGRLAGVEALVRWRHPIHGLIQPEKFVPIAEQTNLVLALDEWCLDAVCRQIRRWEDEDFQVPRVSINISTRHLRNNRIFDDMQRILPRHKVNPNRIGLELTEHSLLENGDTVKSTLDELHNHGVHLSLDDFGTGYSSLTYLKRFPVHELKIDRVFIDGITQYGEDFAITSAIIALGKTLGKKVVAEGVENSAQVAVLHKLECDFVQGHYFSKSLLGHDLRRWSTEAA